MAKAPKKDIAQPKEASGLVNEEKPSVYYVHFTGLLYNLYWDNYIGKPAVGWQTKLPSGSWKDLEK
jgi:hypothetical protein